ncbi:MAG: hypothetical protein ACYTFZ_00710 [Planctomycetota bacterium]
MALAPRIIQAMEILQLPMLALQQRIEQEMQSNPILEMHEPGADDEAPPRKEQGTIDPWSQIVPNCQGWPTDHGNRNTERDTAQRIEGEPGSAGCGRAGQGWPYRPRPGRCGRRGRFP